MRKVEEKNKLELRLVLGVKTKSPIYGLGGSGKRKGRERANQEAKTKSNLHGG